MSEKEQKILETFEKVLPEMTDLEREKLLYFGEGIAFKIAEQKKQESAEALASKKDGFAEKTGEKEVV